MKEKKKPKKIHVLNFHHGSMPFSTWHVNVGTNLCYLHFKVVMPVVYILLIYSKKDRSHRIIILLFFQLLLFFSSHSKKLARKYPWFRSFGSKMKLIKTSFLFFVWTFIFINFAIYVELFLETHVHAIFFVMYKRE